VGKIKNYVEWFNDINPSAWPTWVPGERVEPGDYGIFGREKNFRKRGTVANVSVSEETHFNPELHIQSKAFQISVVGEGKANPDLHTITHVDGQFKLKALRSNAKLLQIDEAFKSELSEPEKVLEWVRQRLMAGKWDPSWVLITGRVRSAAGCAIILSESGDDITLQGTGKVAPGQIVTLAKVGMGFGIEKEAYEGSAWGFVEGARATPVFMDPIRVRTKWWARILPGLGPLTGRKIVDHAGQEWTIEKPPWNFEHLAEEQRYYDPTSSQMSQEEINSLSLHDLFEVVRHLGSNDEEPPPSGGIEDESGGPGDATGGMAKVGAAGLQAVDNAELQEAREPAH
jgi:hypothetical protein